MERNGADFWVAVGTTAHREMGSVTTALLGELSPAMNSKLLFPLNRGLCRLKAHKNACVLDCGSASDPSVGAYSAPHISRWIWWAVSGREWHGNGTGRSNRKGGRGKGRNLHPDKMESRRLWCSEQLFIVTCEMTAVAALESVDCYGYNVEVDIQRCCSNAQKFMKREFLATFLMSVHELSLNIVEPSDVNLSDLIKGCQKF